MNSMPHHDWIHGHARQRPNHPALIDFETARMRSYAEVDRRISRIARALRDHFKVVPKDRVAVIAPNSSLQFELMIALGRIGAIYMPINWRLAAPEMGQILQHGEPRIAFFDAEFSATVGELKASLPELRLEPFGDSDTIATLAGSGPPLESKLSRQHSDIQTVMYTSGTTGFPKGVLLTFGMSFWNAVNLGIPVRITPDTVFLSVMPMFHTAGLNCYANCVLHAGGTILIARAFDAARVLHALSDRALGITHFFGVPSTYQFMAQLPEFSAADLSALSFIGVGGAPLPSSIYDSWASKGVSVVNGFGMTETGPAVTMLAPEDSRTHGTSIGKPLLHVETRIVAASGEEALDGEPGELWVRGPAVTPGYWQAPEITARAFTDGWLRTGDLVSRDAEGFFYILDRIKDMYISGGENIYPAEIENVLYQIDGVVEAAVVGVPDARWGETGFAAVVPRANHVITEAIIRAHCQRCLARFKQPKFIHFLPSLPRTASGKVQKGHLRELAEKAVRAVP